MPELMSRRVTNRIDWRGVPLKWHRKVSAVCRSLSDCEDLVKWYGDPDFCPFLSVLLLIPDHPTILAGLGYATAAELKDDAVNIWGKYTARLAKTGSILDFDDLRERAGQMPREKVKAAMSEAFWERIRHHRENPVTDPFRQPQYANPTNKTLFPVGDKT